MDLVVLKDVVIGCAAVLAAGLAIWGFIQSPSKANAAAIERLGAQIVDALARFDKERDTHERRIQALESELKHLPSKDAVGELKLSIVELKGQVGAMGGTVTALDRKVDIIDNYLRKDGAA